MSLRSRLLDLLPVALVFAVVTAFATFVVVEYVVRQPLVVPPPQRSAEHGEQYGLAEPGRGLRR